MNKIIRDVPVELLPKEWREGLPPNSFVEVQLRTVPKAGERVELAKLVGTGSNVHGSMEEILAHIEELRSDR